MKEFIHKKEKGQLLVHTIQKSMSASLQEVGLSFSRDGSIRVGDHVMLYSVSTQGVLSCDPSDKAPSSDRGFMVTTSTLVKAHVARNTFVIESVGGGAGEPAAPLGSMLRLGQHFRLRLNPVLQDGQPFWLASQPVSSLAASKVSHKQLVSMTSVKSFDTVWKAAWKDINRRFEQDGEPLSANSEIVLIHVATNTCLSSARDKPYANDFGQEFEVCGHSHIDIRKSQGLYAEQQGKTTADIPFRKEAEHNHWAFLTATSEEREAPLRAAAAAASSSAASSSSSSSSSAQGGALTSTQPLIAPILLNVREDLLVRGPDHLFAFLRGARGLDSTHRSGHVSYDDFRRLLLQAGCKLALPDFDTLCRLFDRENDKHVDYFAFLAAIRGPLNASRARVVEAAWAKLDPSNTGSVLLATLQNGYDASHDPDVKMRRKAAIDARESLMAKFRAVSSNGRVDRRDFEEMMAIQSVYAEADAYFVDLVEKTWKLQQGQQSQSQTQQQQKAAPPQQSPKKQ